MDSKYYSPLRNTFGLRPDDFSYSSGKEFKKAHIKVNHKLIKLRHYCNVICKDTHNYTSKLNKLAEEDHYAKNKKLIGALFLQLAERDLIYVESLRLRNKVSNKNKQVPTRLKKASKYTSKMIEITSSEKNWKTRLEYLIYDRLARIEYYLSRKNNSKFQSTLTVEFNKVLAALELLSSVNADMDGNYSSIVEKIKLKYKFISTNGVTINLQDNKNEDEIIKILLEQGYVPSKEGPEKNGNIDLLKEVTWRSYTASIHNKNVAKYITEAMQLQETNDKRDHNTTKDSKNSSSLGISSIDEILLYYNMAEEELNKSMDPEDNSDQILSTFIRYNRLFVLIKRDARMFDKLITQWNSKIKFIIRKHSTEKYLQHKYGEIERISKGLTSYLSQVLALPGVYSDDELTSALNLAIAYYESSIESYCLATLYKIKGKHLESMALFTDALEKIKDSNNNNNIEIPCGIISNENVQDLINFTEQGCESVKNLALYAEKLQRKAGNIKFEGTVAENIHIVDPSITKLHNLFPLKPIVKPVMAKPTLYDLAFNYIGLDNVPTKTQHQEKEKISNDSKNVNNENKKKSFFGLFRG
ncbi:uncharacterized protein SCODWIG_00221 [Saccharomycodes ludwigii]|uniref:Signal recognition particle subunit SRP68 n=1 Tax=Saccharomycodes ludwigii TaxID=36035 RepID=A0A376B2V7_9ASCO|nr:uncharacterized protein SCODWIG_00221 [Saccharomycodes ludwigii]